MPITINLLEEEQQKAVAHLLDPLKIVLRIAYSVSAAVLVANVGLLYLHHRADQELEHTRTEWDPLEKDAQRLEELEKKRVETHGNLGNYYSYISNRLLWGTELEILRRLVPPDIYLTELRGTTRFEKTALPSAPQKAAPVADGEEAPAPRPTAEADVEVREIFIRGRAQGEKFYDSVRDFLNALRSDPDFSSQVADPEDISIDVEPALAQPDPSVKNPPKEATFGIRCKLRPLTIK